MVVDRALPQGMLRMYDMSGTLLFIDILRLERSTVLRTALPQAQWQSMWELQ